MEKRDLAVGGAGLAIGLIVGVGAILTLKPADPAPSIPVQPPIAQWRFDGNYLDLLTAAASGADSAFLKKPDLVEAVIRICTPAQAAAVLGGQANGGCQDRIKAASEG